MNQNLHRKVLASFRGEKGAGGEGNGWRYHDPRKPPQRKVLGKTGGERSAAAIQLAAAPCAHGACPTRAQGLPATHTQARVSAHVGQARAHGELGPQGKREVWKRPSRPAPPAPPPPRTRARRSGGSCSCASPPPQLLTCVPVGTPPPG